MESLHQMCMSKRYGDLQPAVSCNIMWLSHVVTTLSDIAEGLIQGQRDPAVGEDWYALRNECVHCCTSDVL